MEEKIFKNSKVKKLYIILAILLILLIPIGFLKGIVSDRVEYRNTAVSTVKQSWAGEQTLNAPFLNLSSSDGKITKAFVLNNYNVTTSVNTDLRKKGIFTVPVYTANVEIKGDFVNNSGNINNAKAELGFGVSDSKGFVEQPQFKLLDGNLQSVNDIKFSKNITTSEKLIPFEIKYKIRGLNTIFFAPCGQNNKISISGNWANPSFEGDFLPTERQVSNDNFNASWSIPSIANASIKNPKLGVSFLMPVDNYRMSERAVKYSFLFLTLTFLTYFIYEITQKRKNPIHQLQYLLMGIAMLIFYLLLVSMSEFIPFALSYTIAAAMTIGLISIYTYFVITKRENPQFSQLITGILILLYSFLYVLLRLQDLALIAGSFGMFFIIALVMYSTRNIDWYNDN